MTSPGELPDLLRSLQKDAMGHAQNALLGAMMPNVAYDLRRIVLLLESAIEEAQELRAAARGPSTRELEHRMRELQGAGVVTPLAWWAPMMASAGSAA